MNADSFFTRRNFIQSSSIAIGASTVINNANGLMAMPVATRSTSSAEDGLKGRLWKTLKFGMVKVPGSLSDKFKAVRAAGFEGI